MVNTPQESNQEHSTQELSICKLGGKFLGTRQGYYQAVDLYNADPRRRVFVPSAPGESKNHPKKLTNLLIAAANGHGYSHYKQYAIPNHDIDLFSITEEDTISGMLLAANNDDIATLLKEVNIPILGTNNPAEMILEKIAVSCRTYPDSVLQYSANLQYLGELFSGLNLANAFKQCGHENVVVLDPLQLIALNGNNPLEADVLLDDTIRIMRDWKEKNFDPTVIYILPGYYGRHYSGSISLLGRDGSNMSLVLAGYGLDATKLENFTDKKGVYVVNPNYLKSTPAIIPEMTYRELRELASRGGFNVFQARSLKLIQRAGKLPPVIEIKSFENAAESGTRIVGSRECYEKPLVGLGIREKITAITIDDPTMADSSGYIHKLTGCLDSYGLNLLHIRSGEGEITVYVANDYGDRVDRDTLHRSLASTLSLLGNEIEITDNVCILGFVGEGLQYRNLGVQLHTALSQQVSVSDFVDSSKVGRYYVVDREELAKAVSIAYTTLGNIH